MNSFRLYVYHLLAPLMPPTRLYGLKRALLRWAGASIGANVRIASSASFNLVGPLSIGDGTWIGHGALIVGGAAEVRIGREVDIGPRVNLITGSHVPFNIPGKAAGEGFSAPIRIEDGAWVCAAATVLGGVCLGSRCIVAAGALVRKDVGEGEVVAGVPAAPVSDVPAGGRYE